MKVNTYRPRNDYVVIRIERVNLVRGLEMPDVSIESKRFKVVAVGSDVDDLEKGDCVLVLSDQEGMSSYFPIPGNNDLIVVKQEFVALVLESEEE